MEIWKDIRGYEGKYQVSNCGRVKSLQRWDSLHNRVHKREKLLKQNYDRKGYAKVKLYDSTHKQTLPVHRLVATAFILNPDNKPQVNHINGIKADNTVENLEWCSNIENQHHARINGLADNCKKKGKAVVQCDLQGNVVKVWKNIKTASTTLHLQSSCICLCCKGKRDSAGGYIWKYKEAE